MENNNKHVNKVLKALKKGSLSLNEKVLQKYWYSYRLDFNFLTWCRNMRDGVDINIFDKDNGNHLGTAKIDYSTIDFWF